MGSLFNRTSVLYWLVEFRRICLKYERVGGELMDREANSLGEELQVMKMPRDKDDGMRMIMMKKEATKRGGRCQLR